MCVRYSDAVSLSCALVLVASFQASLSQVLIFMIARSYTISHSRASCLCAGRCGQLGCGNQPVTLSDVQSSLQTLLKDKGEPSTGPAGRMLASPPRGGGELPADPPRLAMAHAFDMLPRVTAPRAQPTRAAVATAVATAAPPVSAAEEWEIIDKDVAPADVLASGDFDGLSPAFLTAMQSGLEALGHDLSSLDAVQQLAGAGRRRDAARAAAAVSGGVGREGRCGAAGDGAPVAADDAKAHGGGEGAGQEEAAARVALRRVRPLWLPRRAVHLAVR